MTTDILSASPTYFGGYIFSLDEKCPISSAPQSPLLDRSAWTPTISRAQIARRRSECSDLSPDSSIPPCLSTVRKGRSRSLVASVDSSMAMFVRLRNLQMSLNTLQSTDREIQEQLCHLSSIVQTLTQDMALFMPRSRLVPIADSFRKAVNAPDLPKYLIRKTASFGGGVTPLAVRRQERSPKRNPHVPTVPTHLEISHCRLLKIADRVPVQTDQDMAFDDEADDMLGSGPHSGNSRNQRCPSSHGLWSVRPSASGRTLSLEDEEKSFVPKKRRALFTSVRDTSRGDRSSSQSDNSSSKDGSSLLWKILRRSPNKSPMGAGPSGDEDANSALSPDVNGRSSEGSQRSMSVCEHPHSFSGKRFSQEIEPPASVSIAPQVQLALPRQGRVSQDSGTMVLDVDPGAHSDDSESTDGTEVDLSRTSSWRSKEGRRLSIIGRSKKAITGQTSSAGSSHRSRSGTMPSLKSRSGK